MGQPRAVERHRPSGRCLRSPADSRGSGRGVRSGDRVAADEMMLPMNPLVSIAIPTFNSAQWLSASIESALGQTWPEKEVLVLDDGSTGLRGRTHERNDFLITTS